MFLSDRYVLWNWFICLLNIPMFPIIKIEEKVFTRYHYWLIKNEVDIEEEEKADQDEEENGEDPHRQEERENDDDDDDAFEEEVL